MNQKIKTAIFGSSLMLALAGPLHAQNPQPSKEEITQVEQRIGGLEQNIKNEMEQLETGINQKIEKTHTEIDNLSGKVEKVGLKVDEISKPHWYSGPIGYAVALAIGVVGLGISTGGIFGYDHLKRRKRIMAYNKVAEEYLEDENFDCCVHALESALVINPVDPGTRYGLIDVLIREENNLMKNCHDKDKQERLSEISRRINTEIKVLKNCDKGDFVPYMFEGHRLYFEGERESDVDKKKTKIHRCL